MTEPASQGASAWNKGWYRFARHLHSPNFGPRPPGVTTDLLVLHSISLPPGVYGAEYVQQLFTNRLNWDAHPYFQKIRGLQVSAHFYIQRQGELWQFVSCDDRAWHAGVSTHQGRENCNDFSIGIELEGLEGDRFEAPQYEALLALVPAIAQRYAVTGIVGHEHIAPGRKADPGVGMDWPLLQTALGLPAQYFPDSVRIKNKV